MVIKHLKHNKIDFNKYDACISNANNFRVYALSWYLDTVTNKDWEVLVLDDYKAVMPLPYSRIKQKFFKRLIVQPMYCQQLGVFSITELNTNKFNLILNQFKDLNPYVYCFNSENSMFLTNALEVRNNLELKLDIPYKEIQKNYSKNLTRNLKKAYENKLSITNNIAINDFILMKDNNKKHAIKRKQYKLMKDLIAKILSKKNGVFYGVKKENNVIAIAFFIETNNRLIHLFSTSTQLGKQVGAIAFLFDNIIQKNATNKLIFDFEGSMIKSVAQFFKSFGAKNTPYLTYNNSN